jgi:hypothetical protein
LRIDQAQLAERTLALGKASGIVPGGISTADAGARPVSVAPKLLRKGAPVSSRELGHQRHRYQIGQRADGADALRPPDAGPSAGSTTGSIEPGISSIQPSRFVS